MLYALVTRTDTGKVLKAEVITDDDRATRTIDVESRWDWKTFDAAKEVAAALGAEYAATDSGEGVSPRYDIIKLPQVGEPISYAFNGDYYPCGTIAAVSDSKRIVTSTEGQKFYRRKESGAWIYQRTWSMVRGHISRTNPEF
jgi:hypothetical protein